MRKNEKFTYKEYKREEYWPGSHACHEVIDRGPIEYVFKCPRPAYEEYEGKWWCETHYILHSGAVDPMTLPLYKERADRLNAEHKRNPKKKDDAHNK